MKLAIFLFFIVTISCIEFSNENNTVIPRYENNNLIIENGTADTVYYAAFAENIMQFIDWFPESTTDNQILPNKLVTIPKDRIEGLLDDDTIVVFYWKNHSPPNDVTTVKVNTK